MSTLDGFNSHMRWLLISGLWILSSIAHAQLVNRESIYVGEGTILSSEVPVINEGLLVNNGQLHITSDWDNQNVYQGPGLMEFAGNQPKLIRHNGNPVAHVKVNSSGNLRLQGRFPITGTIQFLEGIWQNSVQDTLIILSTGIAQGGGTASYITGPVHLEGTGYKFAPVGTGLEYLPVTLENVSGGMPLLTVWAYENVPVHISAPAVRRILRKFYWEIKSYDGTYTGSYLMMGFPAEDFSSESLVLLQEHSGGEIDLLDGVGSGNDDLLAFRTNGTPGNGRFIIAERSLAVSDQRAFYFPNTLSYSATMDEDRSLKVFGALKEENFRLVIFNRTGEVVFETSDVSYMQHTGWWGVSQSGNPLPDGSYPYHIRAITKDGDPIEQQGMISLIR